MNTKLQDNPAGRIGPLLRASDVAEILCICISSAYQKMQSGEIRTVRMGRSVRVRLDDLEAYINNCKSG